jgi:hypothetical protein
VLAGGVSDLSPAFPNSESPFIFRPYGVDTMVNCILIDCPVNGFSEAFQNALGLSHLKALYSTAAHCIQHHPTHSYNVTSLPIWFCGGLLGSLICNQLFAR